MRPLLVVKYLRIVGYEYSGILGDNPFKHDMMICDLEHYLRTSAFVKIGKRVLKQFRLACSAAPSRSRYCTARVSKRLLSIKVENDVCEEYRFRIHCEFSVSLR